MKVKPYNLFNLKTIEELGRFVSIMNNDIIRAINGLLTFQDNFACVTIEASFTAANTETEVTHNLGKVPSGYFVIKSNAASVVYDSGRQNTDKIIYLKASAISNVTMIIF